MFDVKTLEVKSAKDDAEKLQRMMVEEDSRNSAKLRVASNALSTAAKENEELRRTVQISNDVIARLKADFEGKKSENANNKFAQL